MSEPLLEGGSAFLRTGIVLVEDRRQVILQLDALVVAVCLRQDYDRVHYKKLVDGIGEALVASDHVEFERDSLQAG